jgi:REP element-mobilizing transposase RayT
VKQLNLLKPESKSYGGKLRNKRKGRGARPIATKESMHLVLKSSKATGDWSFKKKSNSQKISAIIKKFSQKYHVQILSIANVGNHLHLHIHLIKRAAYRPFIRAVTAAISMAITGVSRWRKSKTKIKFWDYRPFTRVIRGFRALLTIKDYVAINQLEGLGVKRVEARFILASHRNSE